jgi:hypothetical protein
MFLHMLWINSAPLSNHVGRAELETSFGDLFLLDIGIVRMTSEVISLLIYIRDVVKVIFEDVCKWFRSEPSILKEMV